MDELCDYFIDSLCLPPPKKLARNRFLPVLAVYLIGKAGSRIRIRR